VDGVRGGDGRRGRAEVGAVRALVVYESMFGNTRAIALAIADGIATRVPVESVEVGSAPASIPDDVGLLVVGGPTHGHGMTTPQTRADATRRAGDRLVSHGAGIREWLEGLAPLPGTVRAAAFDTRIKGPGLLWGSAAKPAAKRLGALGARLVPPPRSFLVGGPMGPMFDRLVTGELDRAREWGAGLAAACAEPVAARPTR
jgi:hypothetical protein